MFGKLFAASLFYPEEAGDDFATRAINGWKICQPDDDVAGWIRPVSESLGTIVYFHGNAETAGDSIDALDQQWLSGLNIAIVEYPSFGLRDGEIPASEDELVTDLTAKTRMMLGCLPTADKPVTFWGRSIGGALAAQVSNAITPDGLILQSTFTSAKAMLTEFSPLGLGRLIPSTALPYSLNTEEILGDLDCEALIVHSPNDTVVPFWHAECNLAAKQGCRGILMTPGDHNDELVFTKTQAKEFLSFATGRSGRGRIADAVIGPSGRTSKWNYDLEILRQPSPATTTTTIFVHGFLNRRGDVGTYDRLVAACDSLKLNEAIIGLRWNAGGVFDTVAGGSTFSKHCLREVLGGKSGAMGIFRASRRAATTTWDEAMREADRIGSRLAKDCFSDDEFFGHRPIDIVAHSLGCRLTLQFFNTLRSLETDLNGLQIRNVIFLGGAIGDREDLNPICDQIDGNLLIAYSRRDVVLRQLFNAATGETAIGYNGPRCGAVNCKEIDVSDSVPSHSEYAEAIPSLRSFLAC